MKKNGIIISTGPQKNKQPYLFLFFGIVFLLWLFEITKPLFFKSFSILPVFLTRGIIDSDPLKIVGTLIIFLSLGLWIITLLNFKNSLRFGLSKNNRGSLITNGIFSFSRNPFFLSLNIYLIGITLINPNLFFIGFAILAAISIHLFILKEEKFLREVYGKEYVKYADKVGRYF